MATKLIQPMTNLCAILEQQQTMDDFPFSRYGKPSNLAEAASPANFLVNLFPALVKIPEWALWTDWKRTAREWREQQQHTVNYCYYRAKAKIGNGEGEASMIRSLLASAEGLGLNADEVDDYVKQTAIMLLIGHQIPKGAIIFGNVWAMSHDPDVYKDPETFDPDRYLSSNIPPPPAFGFGRRLCPGVHYTEAVLFIVVALILSTFNISPYEDFDEQGEPAKQGANKAV
ncbi:cytochrome P450 family protein [Ceratobasidium sp. AG-Ba]|nr:cytochrome P450 family protein [Ceratobasidium sp. AG-Ba]